MDPGELKKERQKFLNLRIEKTEKTKGLVYENKGKIWNPAD